MNIRRIKKHIIDLYCLLAKSGYNTNIITLCEPWLSQHLHLEYMTLNYHQIIHSINNYNKKKQAME